MLAQLVHIFVDKTKLVAYFFIMSVSRVELGIEAFRFAFRNYFIFYRFFGDKFEVRSVLLVGAAVSLPSLFLLGLAFRLLLQEPLLDRWCNLCIFAPLIVLQYCVVDLFSGRKLSELDLQGLPAPCARVEHFEIVVVALVLLVPQRQVTESLVPLLVDVFLYLLVLLSRAFLSQAQLSPEVVPDPCFREGVLAVPWLCWVGGVLRMYADWSPITLVFFVVGGLFLCEKEVEGVVLAVENLTSSLQIGFLCRAPCQMPLISQIGHLVVLVEGARDVPRVLPGLHSS